jgi:hypothetical protein
MESSVLESKPLEVQEKPIGYIDVLKQKEYVKFIIANLINRFGDSVDAIAMTWIVYVAFVTTRVIFLASGFLCVIIFICIGLKKLQFE